MFSPVIALRARHEGFWIKEKLIAFKEAIIARFDSVLPSDEAGALGRHSFGL